MLTPRARGRTQAPATWGPPDPGLNVATYREDGLPRTHPLRLALGDLANAGGVVRLRLEPFSPDAVAHLVQLSPRLAAFPVGTSTGPKLFFLGDAEAGRAGVALGPGALGCLGPGGPVWLQLAARLCALQRGARSG